MKRREFIITLGSGAMTMHASAKKGRPVAQEAVTAETIYKRAYTIDAMCFAAAPPRTYVTYLTEDKVESLRSSGITALAMNVVSGESRLRGVECIFLETKKMIREWDSFVVDHSDVFEKVTNIAQLEKVKRSGKVGFIYNFASSAESVGELRLG